LYEIVIFVDPHRNTSLIGIIIRVGLVEQCVVWSGCMLHRRQTSRPLAMSNSLLYRIVKLKWMDCLSSASKRS